MCAAAAAWYKTRVVFLFDLNRIIGQLRHNFRAASWQPSDSRCACVCVCAESERGAGPWRRRTMTISICAISLLNRHLTPPIQSINGIPPCAAGSTRSGSATFVNVSHLTALTALLLLLLGLAVPVFVCDNLTTRVARARDYDGLL